MEDLRREVAQKDEIASRIGMQAETLSIEMQTPEPRVKLIEKGIVFQPDQRGRRVLISTVAAVGAFALALFGLTWWEWRSLRINTADEVARGVGLKVMGALPLLPAARKGAARPGAVDWHNLLLESVDLTRTALLHVSRVEGVRVVMVTSAVSGEGKTSLSSHLATSLARAGRKTLLIDCDLRKPSLHQVFELPRPEGVCEVLRGQIPLAEAVQETPTAPGLFVIAGGKCCARALNALAQGSIAPLFATLRDQYDFIVVDSSPVLPVADALLVAQEADAVLFSILRDVSQLGLVNAAYERLAMLGIRALGAVITGVAGDLYYGSHHRYYRGYAEGNGNDDGEGEDTAGDAEQADGEQLIQENP
jgi:capsular exopolysaccharide synthesis family protein